MSKLHTYFLAESYSDDQFTAGIVRKDNEKIMLQMGFQPLRFNQTQKGSLLVKLRRILHAYLLPLRIPVNSLVVMHYPFLAKAHALLLKRLQKKNIKTVALIIDLEGLREKSPGILEKEVNELQQFDFIIAHNESMQSLLADRIPGKNISAIGLFDYPVTVNNHPRPFEPLITFAGNLAKSGFIQSLHQFKSLRFHLYGNDCEPLPASSTVTCKGTLHPHQLPDVIEGSFGLVWDGNYTDRCDEYLRYNHPHKFSLYLVSGLPVIVWKESALAGFVTNNRLGITIEALHEIPAALQQMSADAYQQMQHHVLEKGQELSKGTYLKEVLKKIIRHCE